MTTYDPYGRPVQSVDPGLAVAGIAAAGLIGYAVGQNNEGHQHGHHGGYGRAYGGYGGHGGDGRVRYRPRGGRARRPAPLTSAPSSI